MELHATFGPTLVIAFGAADTVADIKAKVEAQTGVAVAAQIFSFAAAPAFHISVALPPSMHATLGPMIRIAYDPASETIAQLKATKEAAERRYGGRAA